MKHISIIHSEQQNKFHVPYDTLEDLKLTGILPANVLNVMQSLPSGEDIIIRQEIFRYLYENGTAEPEHLLSQLIELKKLFYAYGNAGGMKSKQYIFAALIHRICVFYRDSAQLKAKVGFFEGYCKHFSELCDESLSQEAERVYNKLIRDITVTLKEDKLIIGKTAGQGYVSAICRCAADMGIPLTGFDFAAKPVGEELIEAISELYPEIWGELEVFYSKYKDYPDEDILSYIDQLEFYISNTELARKYSSHSVPISYANITGDDMLCVTEGYDITLMAKQCYDIVPNDFFFDRDEKVFFLAGANGGGKTTYLRALGVNVIMALCGCPVPCRSVKLCRLDGVFTHFPKDERFELDGRFIDEQKRVDAILGAMGKRSLILLNETYATTNEQKANEMTCELALRLRNEGQYCVYVTHQKGVYELDIPMLCCVVDEEDSNRRTYKIRRVKETVTSHAEDILRKYSLSRADLEERIGI